MRAQSSTPSMGVDISQLVSNLDKLKEGLNNVIGKDIVPIVGDTGIGKSLLSYLLTVDGVHCDIYSSNEIRLNPQKALDVTRRLPDFESSSESKTLFCEPYPINPSEEDLWVLDCPGQNDNRDIAHCIPAKIGFRYNIEKCRTVRAVIVMLNYSAIATQKRGAGMGCFDIFRELFSRFGEQELRSVIFVMNHSVISGIGLETTHIDYNSMRDILCKHLAKDPNDIAQYIGSHKNQVVMMSGYNLADTKKNIMDMIKRMGGRCIDKNKFNFSGLADLKYDAATRLLDGYITGAQENIQRYLNLYKDAKSLHDFISDNQAESDSSELVFKCSTPSEKVDECKQINKRLMIEHQRNIEHSRRRIESLEEDRSKKLFQVKELESDTPIVVSTKEREMKRGWFSGTSEIIEYRCSDQFEIRAKEMYEGELQEHYTNNWKKGIYRKTYAVGLLSSEYRFKIEIIQKKCHVFHQKIEHLKDEIRTIGNHIEAETVKSTKQQQKMEEIRDDMTQVNESNIDEHGVKTHSRVMQSREYISSKTDEIKKILDTKDVKRFILSRQYITHRMETISELVKEFGSDIGVVSGDSQAGWFADAIEELKSIDFESMRLFYFDSDSLCHHPSLADEYSHQAPIFKYVPLSDITPVSETKSLFIQPESVLSLGNWAKDLLSNNSYGVSSTNTAQDMNTPQLPSPLEKTLHEPIQTTRNHEPTSTINGLDCSALCQFISDGIESGSLVISTQDKKNLFSYLVDQEYDGDCVHLITLEDLSNHAKIKHAPARKIINFIQKHAATE